MKLKMFIEGQKLPNAEEATRSPAYEEDPLLQCVKRMENTKL